jgi:hypothetical protein
MKGVRCLLTINGVRIHYTIEGKGEPALEIKDAGHVNCIFKAQFKEGIGKWIAEYAGDSKTRLRRSAAARRKL